MARVHDPCHVKAMMEFVSLTFDLAQPLLLGAAGKWTSGWKLYVHVCVCLSNKNFKKLNRFIEKGTQELSVET